MFHIEGSPKLLVPVTCFIGFFIGVENGGLQYILLQIANEYGLSNATMGTLISAQFLAILICPLIVGRISDLIGKKQITMLFCIVFAIGCAITVGVNSFMALAAGIFIIGMGFGAVENSTTAALSDAYREKSGKYINLMQCTLSVGSVLSPIVASYAINKLQFTWRIVFVICIIAFLLSAIITVFTKFVQDDVEETDGKIGKVSVKKLCNLVMISLVLCVMAYVALENGVTFFFNTFFTDVLKSSDHSAMAISAFWLAMALSRFLGSFLYRKQKYVVVIGYGMVMIILGFFSVMTSALGAVGLCFLLGIFCGPIWPFLMSMANQEFPKDTGTVSSIMLAAGGLGGAGMPIIVGLIADVSSIRSSFVFLSVVSLASMLVFCIYFRKKRLL